MCPALRAPPGDGTCGQKDLRILSEDLPGAEGFTPEERAGQGEPSRGSGSAGGVGFFKPAAPAWDLVRNTNSQALPAF